MPHSTQLDSARRDGYLWTRPCRRGWINSSSYSRKLESREVTPRDLCKQEALTFGVQSWKLCVFESFTHERREEVWGKWKTSTSLHGTVSHPREVWNCDLQAWPATILARVHDIFHMLQLKKCLKTPVDIVLPEVTPLEADLSYSEHQIKVLD
jgi:hypothetical protein